MKVFLAILFVAAATADRLENTYLPPSNAPTAGGNGNFLGAPVQAQSNNYLPPRNGNGNGNGNGVSHRAPAPQFNGNSYVRQQQRPSFNQGTAAAPAVKYGAPSAPSTRYGAPDLKFKGPDARFGSDAPAGVFSSNYNNGNNGNNGFSNGNQGYNGNAQAFSGAGQSVDGGAAILKFKNDNNGDGSYSFEYETENKIMHQEAGTLRAAGGDEDSIAVQGSYSYTGPDGVVYTVNYVADENGFQAYGDHLPTPPPVPEAILKSLEQNAAEEAAQNGQGGYGSGPQQGQYNNGGNQQQYNGNQGYSNGQQQYQGFKPQGQSFNAQQGYKY